MQNFPIIQEINERITIKVESLSIHDFDEYPISIPLGDYSLTQDITQIETKYGLKTVISQKNKK